MSGGLQVRRFTCQEVYRSGGLQVRRSTGQEVYRSEGFQVRKVLKLPGLTGPKLSCKKIDGQKVNRLTPKGINKSGSLQVWRFTGQKVKWGY